MYIKKGRPLKTAGATEGFSSDFSLTIPIPILGII